MKRLVLLGGGHAHLQVLAALARRPLDDWQVSLVTPQPRQIYSGMLPGWIAGHYALDDCMIDIVGLARRARTGLQLDAAAALNATRQTVTTAQGHELPYDALSIDVGSAPGVAALPGAREHGVSIRPVENFVAQWPPLAQRLHATRECFDVTVLGGGAAGVELAFALRQRGRREGWTHLQVHLAGAEEWPLPSLPMRHRRRALAALRQRGIAWHGHHRAVALQPDGIRLDDGHVLRCEACWVVTGGAAPVWPGSSGLATDADGYVRVTVTLQSVSHPNVFAAGDAASHPQPVPKSGVYAVRAGAHLARNLMAYCEGRALAPWRPQARALYLISTGDHGALAAWGDWAAAGRWVWIGKDWIDRRFVRSFAGA